MRPPKQAVSNILLPVSKLKAGTSKAESAYLTIHTPPLACPPPQWLCAARPQALRGSPWDPGPGGPSVGAVGSYGARRAPACCWQRRNAASRGLVCLLQAGESLAVREDVRAAAVEAGAGLAVALRTAHQGGSGRGWGGSCWPPPRPRPAPVTLLLLSVCTMVVHCASDRSAMHRTSCHATTVPLGGSLTAFLTVPSTSSGPAPSRLRLSAAGSRSRWCTCCRAVSWPVPQTLLGPWRLAYGRPPTTSLPPHRERQPPCRCLIHTAPEP